MNSIDMNSTDMNSSDAVKSIYIKLTDTVKSTSVNSIKMKSNINWAALKHV